MSGATPTAARSIWRNADFVRLWLAGGVSGVGARITREGLPLTAVLALGATPGEIGLLAALRAAPSLIVGLTCGGWVDRGRRRRILVLTDLGRAGLLLLVPLAALAHRLVLSEIYLAAAIVGGLSSLYDMADHAYLPSVVDRDQLVPANSALGAADSVAEIGGPAVAGALFSLFTAPLAIAANCLTYAVSALILLRIRRPEPPAATGDGRSGGGGRVLEGVSLAWASRTVRPLWLLVLTSSLFGSFFSALYIPFAVQTLRLTPAMLGITIAVGGIGALAGAALAGPASRVLGLGPALIASALLYAAFTAIIPLAGGSPGQGMAVLMAAQLLGDAAGTALYIYIASLRQGLLPPGVLGRVAGAFAAAQGLAAIVGALGGGALATALGVRAVMALACAGMAAAPLWCAFSPLRRTRGLPDDKADAQA